jgi:hypothetical protein
MKRTFKDKLTNYCAVVIAICGGVVGAIQAGLVLPQWVNTTCILGGVIAGAVIGVMTGKDSNGVKKTE